MAQTRELRRRIKGIGNTKKITKAMELVAASKMRRAVNAALATRTYAYQALELMANLARNGNDAEAVHPLFVQRPVRNGLLIVFSSDRGLAGGLNTQVVRQALEAAEEFGATPFSLITVGKKAADGLRSRRLPMLASFSTPIGQPSVPDVRPIAKIATEAFLNGTADRVLLVWTDYRSPLVQKPMRRALLPIDPAALRATVEETGGVFSPHANTHNGAPTAYLFEPSPAHVLSAMLPRLVEMQLYQALLEATASEHAARMVAMRNATDAANDLIDDLTLSFNQARQAGITQDLAEISASRAALS